MKRSNVSPSVCPVDGQRRAAVLLLSAPHRQEILIDSGCQLLAANAGDVISTAGTKLNRLAAEKNILK